jgi:hypothetical protein
MRRALIVLLFCTWFGTVARAVSKPHTVTFGRWQTVKWLAGPAEDQVVDLRIRPLLVDGKVKEYTSGATHDVTERLLVVQRVFRLNDGLPDDKLVVPRWLWEPGGWLLVDRQSGRVTPLSLPEFDAFTSAVAWYRDYAAYCGLSDDGKKIDAIVVQLGRRKPNLRKLLVENRAGDASNPVCPAPIWQRQPARVTFAPPDSQKLVFSVRRRVVDLVSAAEDVEESTE